MMKFIIKRVNRDWNKKEAPPCKNAQRNEYGQWVVEINTLSELMRELNKDNPDVDFNNFKLREWLSNCEKTLKNWNT